MKIKKCPCCGGEANIKKWLLYGGESWIECSKCGLSTKHYGSDGFGEGEKLAIGNWNSRPFWVDVDKAVPQREETVLVIVSGKPAKSIVLKEAVKLAIFVKDEGWILEQWPNAESIEVHYWAYIPELPEELRGEEE